jgi:hypothetical protein
VGRNFGLRQRVLVGTEMLPESAWGGLTAVTGTDTVIYDKVSQAHGVQRPEDEDHGPTAAETFADSEREKGIFSGTSEV